MNNKKIYHPLTATPFKRNFSYSELSLVKNCNPISDAIGEQKILLCKDKLFDTVSVLVERCLV